MKSGCSPHIESYMLWNSLLLIAMKSACSPHIESYVLWNFIFEPKIFFLQIDFKSYSDDGIS